MEDRGARVVTVNVGARLFEENAHGFIGIVSVHTAEINLFNFLLTFSEFNIFIWVNLYVKAKRFF